MGNSKSKRLLSEEELVKSLGSLEDKAQEETDDLEEMTNAANERVSKGGKKKAKKGFPFKKKPEADEEGSDDAADSDEDESEDISKSHTAREPGMPDDTSEADGGLAAEGASRDRNFPSVRSQNSKPTQKSLRERMLSSEQVKKGFEISEFLEAVADTQVEAFDEMSKSMDDFKTEQRAFNKKISKALVAIGEMLMSKQDEQDEDEENEPAAAPRSVRKSLDDGRTVERFQKSGMDGAPQYSREQTLDVLVNLAEQGKVDVLLPSVYESTGVIPAESISVVNGALQKAFPSKN